MLDHASKAIGFVGDMSFETFADDERTQFASIRALEIVGEAARGVPDEIRAHAPDIPWARVIGMRNILAHDYMGTNPRVVFDTVRLFLPDLIFRLEALAVAIDRAPRAR